MYCGVIVSSHSYSINFLPLLAFAAVDVGSFVELNHVRFLACCEFFIVLCFFFSSGFFGCLVLVLEFGISSIDTTVEILELPEFYDQLTSTIICKARELGKVIVT